MRVAVCRAVWSSWKMARNSPVRQWPALPGRAAWPAGVVAALTPRPVDGVTITAGFSGERCPGLGRCQVGLIGDGLEPVGSVVVAAGDDYGDVDCEGIGGCAVPVVYPRRARDGFACSRADDGAIASPDESHPFKDVEGLAVGWTCQLVRAPGVKWTMAAER
jgi:hypothetical protein